MKQQNFCCGSMDCHVLSTHRQRGLLLLVIGVFVLLWPTATTHAQQVDWVVATDGLANIEGYAIAVAADGGSVVTGSFQETKYFGAGASTPTWLTSRGSTDIFLARYAPSGSLLWVTAAGSAGSDLGAAVALDMAGNSYLTGRFTGLATFGEGINAVSLQSRGLYDLFLAKFDEHGNLVWVQQAGGRDSIRGMAIAAAEDGTTYVIGTFTGDVTFAPDTQQSTTFISQGQSDLFLARFGADGTLQWVIQAGGIGNDIGAGIAIDAVGTLYLTGSFAQTASFGMTSAQATTITSSGNTDIFVARYSADGVLNWITKAGGTTDDMGRAIAVDADGNSTVTGSRGTELYIARHAADGQRLWVASGSSTSGWLWANGVAVDSDGNSYVVGELSGRGSFYFERNISRVVQFGMSSVGQSDGIVLTYNADGTQMWGRTIGGGNPDTATGVAVDNAGWNYVVGTFWSEGQIYPLQVKGPGQQLFVTRFAPTNEPIIVSSTADPGDGTCQPQECTLREALNLANNVLLGENTIAFNISGPGPHTIRPIGDLPEITDSVIIDGFTQPGAQPNTNPRAEPINAVIMIELDGSQARLGLQFTGNSWNSVVRGLAINRFAVQAISDSRRIVLEGNFIGTDPSGTQALGNGIGFYSGGGIGGTTPRVGGNTPAARNLIAGNGTGIYIGALSFGTIEGNFIGTDATGTGALGNNVGVLGSNCVGCELGRITLINNLISGNETGARINYMCCSIAGNLVGTDRTGQAPLPNRGDGLVVNAFDLAVANNVVAYNGGNGIRVTDSGGPNSVTLRANRIFANRAAGIVAIGNRVAAQFTQNSIVDNGTLGIDLGNDGLTLNDPGDSDDGPNLNLNYPEIALAGSNGAESVIAGVFDGTPNRTITLEFFANQRCDPSGYGEGESWLATETVTTDANGAALFTVNLPQTIPAGRAVTATATDAALNSTWPGVYATSEFAQCRGVAGLVNGLVALQEITTTTELTPVIGGPAGTFTILATFENQTDAMLTDLFFNVTTLSNNNLLLNAMGGPSGGGALLTVPGYIAAGGSFQVEFQLGLQVQRPFDFFVDAYGLPADAEAAQFLHTQPLATPFDISVNADDFSPDNILPKHSNHTIYLPFITQ